MKEEHDMTTITIPISDYRAFKLQELSAEFGVPIEDLVRISLEELLLHPQQTFQQTVDYVLEKNAELYRRLA